MIRSWLLLLAWAGCRSSPSPAAAPPEPPTTIANTTGPTSTPPTRTPSEQARQLYMSRCALCHGNAGGGDGPASPQLDPKPNDYRLAAWQASVTDEQLRTIIVRGGQAVGKSVLMPASPDLEQQPELVNDLVALIRSFVR